MTTVEPDPAVEVLLARYHETGDSAIRDRIVEDHIGLVRHFARRFAGGQSDQDLEQVAYVGLLLAIDRFDPARGLQFVRFASPTIIGELKRHLRDKSWGIHVPRRVKELHLAINKVVPDLTQRLGRSPRVAQIADALGATEEAVLEAMDAGHGYRLGSIDAPGAGRDGLAAEALVDRLGADDAALARVEAVTSVRSALTALPRRDRDMLRLRYYEGLTQSEIAERLGCSQVHVSRLLARSLEQVRVASGLTTPGC